MHTHVAGQATSPAQPLILSILCFCLLPQAIFIATALTIFKSLLALFHRPIRNAVGRKRILVTGGNTASILGMARALEAAGHEVYVIDYEPAPFSSPLRSSNSIAKFVGLPTGNLASNVTAIQTRFFHLGSIINISFDISRKLPLTTILATIQQLIESKKLELWIPIQESGLQTVLQTRKIVTKHSSCQIYGPDTEVTRLSQDQDLFSQHLEQLEHDVRYPSPVVVRSRAEVHRLLYRNPTGQKYILEKKALPLPPPVAGKIEVDLDSRVYQMPKNLPVDQQYALPQLSLNETFSLVAALPISREQPWLMHQVVEGRPVNVSALIINNTVSTFTASISSQTTTFSSVHRSRNSRGLTHVWWHRGDWQQYDHARPLDPKSATAQMLLDFAERFSSQLPTSTNAQLNLHFILTESAAPGGVVQRIWATGCDFEISPLLIQQALTYGQVKSVGAAYGCALNGGPTLLSKSSATFEDRDTPTTYSLPATAYQNLFQPVVAVILFQAPLKAILIGVAVFLNQIAFGREELFDGKDPLPWVWRWFVQLPFEVSAETIEKAIGVVVRCIKQRKHD
ncbi:hypothetical protein E2P81_ATG00148 [Venturia nashicola]|nr:hypothetical protein E2P81_ATG00148 [Venturia nashicola]